MKQHFEIFKCDVCGKECGNSIGQVKRKQNGKFNVDCYLLDMLGDPCANGNIYKEVCDNCLHRIVKVINEEADKIRNELKI